MLSITPCQRMVSDRFPVASFVVHVPPTRLFEIACATDPTLFRGDQRHRRSPENFFTSRGSGLLRAAAGQATYLVPSDALRRFAGRQRLYFALGAYGSVRGDDPVFTVAPHATEQIPSIGLSPDFTGRTLDRGRLRNVQADPRYGARQPPTLTWGGDMIAERVAEAQRAPAAPQHHEYDDGYPKDLWRGREKDDPPDPPDSFDRDEPDGFEDAPELRSKGGYGNPIAQPSAQPKAVAYGRCTACEQKEDAPGYEDAPAMKRAGVAPMDVAPAYGAPAYSAPAYGARSMEEPPGFEDGPAMMRAQGAPRFGAAQTAPMIMDEPSGFEDAPDAARRKPRRFGNGADMQAGAVQSTAPSAVPANPTVGDVNDSRPPVSGGVDEGYDDTHDGEGNLDLEITPSSQLTIKRKFEIILPVTAFESGNDRYAALSFDPRVGLQWGLIHFNQRSGALGRVLIACQRRDGLTFRQMFGHDTDRLLQVTNSPVPSDRMTSIGGMPLWQEPWLSHFRQASKMTAFQAAQNEVALEDFFDPNLSFAAKLGFTTDRALAMLYDRTVAMGMTGGRKWVLAAVSPIKTEADITTALSALGKSSLTDFQATIPGLVGRGFGPKTHAAMLGALRALGSASPIQLPGLSDMLDKMVDAAKGRPFEGRLNALRKTAQYSDRAEVG